MNGEKSVELQEGNCRDMRAYRNPALRCPYHTTPSTGYRGVDDIFWIKVPVVPE
jgi:hypothetical protein